MEKPLLGFEGAKQKQRLQIAKTPVLCLCCACVGVVQPIFPPQSCLLPRFFRTFPPPPPSRSPQHLRNPDESRACSCFLSSSAAATSCRWFVAVDLASPLLCTAAAGFLVRCGISGAPSIRTDSDRPLRSWVSDSSFALPLCWRLELARLVLGDLSLPSASVQVRIFLARLPVGSCAAWCPCYRVENPSRIFA